MLKVNDEGYLFRMQTISHSKSKMDNIRQFRVDMCCALHLSYSSSHSLANPPSTSNLQIHLRLIGKSSHQMRNRTAIVDYSKSHSENIAKNSLLGRF